MYIVLYQPFGRVKIIIERKKGILKLDLILLCNKAL